MADALTDVISHVAKVGFVACPASEDVINAARARGVPRVLLDLYRIANGLFVVKGDDFAAPDGQRYRFRVVPADELQTVAEFGYASEDSPLFERLNDWWQFLDCGDSNWVGITDADDGRRVVDLFHENVGDPGSHAVIAKSLAEFVLRIVDTQTMYWLNDEFHEIAYV